MKSKKPKQVNPNTAPPHEFIKYVDELETYVNKLEDQDGNSSKPLLITVALSEIEESNRNGMDWFNSYQDIDNFLFDELDKKGLEFITEFEKPELNTIASIKLLMCNCG